MSDTPRTDERILQPSQVEFFELVSANFARGLERELKAAQSTIRQQQLLDEENTRLKERVKRLEEAGDQMEPWCKNDLSCINWRKAKEAA